MKILKEEIKIRYIEFKNKIKYNLTTLDNGDLKKTELKTKKLREFKISEDKSLKIPLTIKDKCECDKLIIDNYEKESIENMVFRFEYFCPEDKNKYLIKIYYTKNKMNFFERFIKNDTKKFWKIEVGKIEKNETISQCMETSLGSSEGIEFEKILKTSEKNIQEKLIEILKKHKYNNVCLEYENLTLLVER